LPLEWAKNGGRKALTIGSCSGRLGSTARHKDQAWV